MSASPTPAFAGRTIVCAVLDRSGSMEPVVSETIGGYNGFIDNLKAEKLSQHLVTLTVFDTDVDVLYALTPLEAVAKLTTNEYKIGGMTALYDALAETINAVDQQVTGDDRVLILVVTDGQENSSKEITSAAEMKKIIDRYTARDNWTFTYLSASLSAFGDASSIGVSGSNTRQYQATREGTQSAFAGVAVSTANYSRSASSAVLDFYAPDHDSVPAPADAGSGTPWGTAGQQAIPTPPVPAVKKPRRKSVASQMEELAGKK